MDSSKLERQNNGICKLVSLIISQETVPRLLLLLLETSVHRTELVLTYSKSLVVTPIRLVSRQLLIPKLRTNVASNRSTCKHMVAAFGEHGLTEIWVSPGRLFTKKRIAIQFEARSGIQKGL